MVSTPSSALTSASFWAGGAGAEAAGSGGVGGIGYNFNGAALDEECFSIHQSVGDLFMSGFENSAERLARNAHFLRGVGLIKSLEIGQADRLDFIDGQCHLLQSRQRDSSRFVVIRLRQLGHPSAMSRSRHSVEF